MTIRAGILISLLALAAIFTRTEAATVSDADVAQILGRLDDVLEKRGCI